MGKVKGLLLVKGDTGLLEVAVYLKDDWMSVTNSNYLLVESIDGKQMAYNTRDITSIREATDKEWADWMTRLELVKRASNSEDKLKDLMDNVTNNNKPEEGESQ